MKKIKIIMAYLFACLVFISCRKERCISCIEQDASGTVVNHRVACDKSNDYLFGFEKGFTEKAKSNGNTAICAFDE
ncbi:MAG: hypothetical protein MUC49_04380 [Raineya sp.]|jgi:hypothetical protein|nr:hypothetical protein [Raineya sp.]